MSVTKKDFKTWLIGYLASTKGYSFENVVKEGNLPPRIIIESCVKEAEEIVGFLEKYNLLPCAPQS